MENNTNNTYFVNPRDEEHRDFDTRKADYCNALVNGADTSAPLLALANAFAVSVLNKVNDPQRKTATARDEVSNNGLSPALVSMKRDLYHDRELLARTEHAVNAATAICYTPDGDATTEVVDKVENRAAAVFCRQTLSDGYDLLQTAAAAILEQTAEHADGTPDWIDRPYTVRRLSKRVYIRDSDSAAYRDEETTPAREIFRAVRAAVANSRAVQTDPRNGYTYIEELTADGLDTIYFRLQKYADLGGYDCNGQYTADRQTARDYDELLTALNLTARQAQIVRLRMQGKGNKAIATYLGVSYQAVQNTLAKIQKKAAAIGLTPAATDKGGAND